METHGRTPSSPVYSSDRTPHSSGCDTVASRAQHYSCHGPLEQCLVDQIAHHITNPSKDPITPPGPSGGSFPAPDPDPIPTKCSRKDSADHDSFACLKHAFLSTTFTPASFPGPSDPSLEPPVLLSPKRQDDESPMGSEDEAGSSRPCCTFTPCPADPTAQDQGSDMLDPNDILYPCFFERVLAEKMANYVAGHPRKPLEEEGHNHLRVKCLYPVLEGKVALTPNIDPKMTTFMAKLIKDPKKDIDWSSWSAYLDMLLDAMGPVTMILGMAEDAKTTGALISLETLLRWAQHAIIILGNTNCALSAEQCHSMLINVDQKLCELVTSERVLLPWGLSGDPFIKELGKFVNTFTYLDKAQSSIKKVFSRQGPLNRLCDLLLPSQRARSPNTHFC
ncbi:hypothetical protein NDU88_004599 [Pleurodeles waltl]|uniref:Uncharacterized protein n=1 Tax=Pleurodeles waltl TaxID=8319 RepID=A0AAV7VGN7_PLEWA|nr:hypothetical protein NDU88_004599 [Pleurodeles waltl]